MTLVTREAGTRPDNIAYLFTGNDIALSLWLLWLDYLGNFMLRTPLITNAEGPASPFTANIYFPAIPTIASAFHRSIEDINLTVTVYMIVQALCECASDYPSALYAYAYKKLPRRGGLLPIVKAVDHRSCSVSSFFYCLASGLLLRPLRIIGYLSCFDAFRLRGLQAP